MWGPLRAGFRYASCAPPADSAHVIVSDVVHDSETIPTCPNGLRAAPPGLVTATQPPADDLQRYLRQLDHDMRDVDGRLLRAGTFVLVNPVAPDEIAEDTPTSRRSFIEGGYAWSPAARAKLWFPCPDAVSATLREQLSAAEASKQRFLAAIADNLAQARYEAFPQVNLPLAMRAVPWEPRIWRVSEVADLSSELADAVRQSSGVPANVAWPEERKRVIDRLHGLKVFEVASLFGRIHVVAAFACPFTMRPAEAPQLQSPAAATIEQVRSVYQQWLQRDSARRPLYVFMSVGSFSRWDVDVKGLVDDRTWVLCSSLDNETWASVSPPTLSARLAIRDFVDRLKPETRGERIARIRAFVDRELDSGEDRVNLERVRRELRYRRSAIRDVFFALQDLKHYRVTKTGDGLLAIDRHVEWADQRVTRADFGVGLVRRSLATILSFTLILVPKVLYDIFSGNPLNWESYLVFMIISAFVGPYTDKIRSRLRERRDKD
jgi:hypothetical protein